MMAGGVTPESSAKVLVAHLAYWDGAAVEEIREFEAGRRPAKKRTRGKMERINRELVSANRATPRHLLREVMKLAKTENAAEMQPTTEVLSGRATVARICNPTIDRHGVHTRL